MRLALWSPILALSPTLALAAGNSYKWCVDSSGGATNFFCTSPDPCDDTFTTVADALAAATAAPDASPGNRPAFQEICIATPGIHTEAIVIDDSSGEIAPTVALSFVNEVGPTWCSPLGSGIEFTGSGGSTLLQVTNLWWDEAVCGPSDGGAALDVVDAVAEVNGMRVVGGSGTGYRQSGSSLLANYLYKVRIEGREGTAIDTERPLSLLESELSANRPPSGEPVLWSRAPAELNIHQSVLFGNFVSGGAPVLRSEGGGELRSVVLADNVVDDGGPLLLVVESPTGLASRFSIRSGVFSGNRLLDSTTSGAAAPIATGRSPYPGSEQDFCLPEASEDLAVEGRVLPAASGVAGGGALVLLDGGASLGRFDLDLLGSFVVGNEMGSAAAVLRVTGPPANSKVALLHNTIELPEGLLVEHQGTGGGALLMSARNLYLGQTTLGALDGFSSFEFSMDQGPSVADLYSTLVSLAGVVGPLPQPVDWSDATNFREGSEVRSLDDCLRAQLLCPELSCPASEPVPREWFCALGQAADYIPTAGSGTASALEWPWSTDYFGIAGTGEPSNQPGPTGWICEERFLPFDQKDSVTGDGDGYSGLVDCDNTNPDIVPQVPVEDGFESTDCWDIADDCFECPPGSNLIDPPGDDDDSGDDDDMSDDDDAGDDDSTGDDDTTGDDDDDTAGPFDGQEVPVGCGPGRGCGVPIGSAVLPILLVGGVRRRRRWVRSA